MHKYFVLVTLGVFLGCGAGGDANRLPTYKVTGKVTMGGSAVASATVTFSPTAPGKPGAAGITDSLGVYSLTTYVAGDGAPEGDYKILVYKEAPKAAESTEKQHDPRNATSAAASGPPGPQGHAKADNKKGGTAGSLLPEKYAKASDTPLQKKVAASDDNTIDLEL